MCSTWTNSYRVGKARVHCMFSKVKLADLVLQQACESEGTGIYTAALRNN